MPGRNGRSWKWMPLLVVGMFVVELSMGSSSGRGQPGAPPGPAYAPGQPVHHVQGLP